MAAKDLKAIANYFIEKSFIENKLLTPMQLQKLIFFAHGVNLAVHESPLIKEEFEAWDYGPVIRSLYFETKYYGSGNIDRKLTALSYKKNSSKFNLEIITPIISQEDKTVKEILDFVWENYGKYNAIQLSNITHKVGTPWEVTYKKGVKGVIIPNEVIKQYYQSRIASR
ncbi:MAG: type II toxin-antitoxin system antitoxin SocA domain-containing protein [Bdellovibrionota bacterium]